MNLTSVYLSFIVVGLISETDSSQVTSLNGFASWSGLRFETLCIALHSHVLLDFKSDVIFIELFVLVLDFNLDILL